MDASIRLWMPINPPILARNNARIPRLFKTFVLPSRVLRATHADGFIIQYPIFNILIFYSNTNSHSSKYITLLVEPVK